MNISYGNWWRKEEYDKFFYPFLMHHFGFRDINIRIYSSFGKKSTLEEKFCGVKVFFSGENLEEPVGRFSYLGSQINPEMREEYKDYAVDIVDISLGYSNVHAENYLRFPGYIKRLLPPDSNYCMVKKIVKDINMVRVKQPSKAFVCVASHDKGGMRGFICDDIERHGYSICYGGRWRNNSNELKEIFADNKIRYITDYLFNICAENVNAPLYCTEKIFDAFQAGSIPIYIGAQNNPEPDVINKDAVIFWNEDGNNNDNIKLIRDIIECQSVYSDFVSQPKMMNSAADYLYERLYMLEIMIKDAIMNN